MPPGRPRRPLVPDIAYVTAERMRGRSDEEIRAHAFAPDVAIEVLTRLVIVVDPDARTMISHAGSAPVSPASGDALRHATLPEFALDRLP